MIFAKIHNFNENQQCISTRLDQPDGSWSEFNVPDETWLRLDNGSIVVTTPALDVTTAVKEVRQALQAAIDIKAGNLGFSGGNALMLYASFTNPFKSVALPFAQWESTVWAEAEAYKQEVIAGTKPMLTGEEAVLLMPELNLPSN